MKPEDYKLLLRSFDDALVPSEQEQLDRLLEGSSEVREERRNILAIRDAVRDTRDDSFGPFFADRVMRRITKPGHGPSVLVEKLRSLFVPQGFARWTVVAGFATAVVALLIWFQPVRVDVPNAQTRLVSLPDGSSVTLNSGASLRYPRTRGRSVRLVSLTGEGFFDVLPAAEPFVVETFNAQVTVKGTRFNVRAWPGDEADETVVSLEHGAVEVHTTGRDAVVRLEPGQLTRVVGDNAPLEPADVGSNSVAGWRTGAIVFLSEPLADVLRALQRLYDIELSLGSHEIGSRTVTYINPSPDSAENVLADICFSLKLQYRSTAGGFEVIQP